MMSPLGKGLLAGARCEPALPNQLRPSSLLQLSCSMEKARGDTVLRLWLMDCVRTVIISYGEGAALGTVSVALLGHY